MLLMPSFLRKTEILETFGGSITSFLHAELQRAGSRRCCLAPGNTVLFLGPYNTVLPSRLVRREASPYWKNTVRILEISGKLTYPTSLGLNSAALEIAEGGSHALSFCCRNLSIQNNQAAGRDVKYFCGLRKHGLVRQQQM